MPEAHVDSYAGPLLITVAYVAVYYAMLVNQLVVKTRLRREYKARGERFDRYFNTDRVMLAADRYAGNMLDHMPPFLVLLWLNAVFVSPLRATAAGAVYVACRVAYPWLMGRELGRSVPTRILFATVVGYAVIAFFCVSLVVRVAT
jgi:hypothetical protein